jgi:peptidoglycan/xylan/chitin deacetylase (PgdA/CDA1 family)
MVPTVSVSVDLDPLPCYYRIHALGHAPDELRAVVLERALPRLAEVFAAHGVRATWFVVGADLDPAEVGAAAAARATELLAARVAAGDELGNHSDRHPYDLARRDRAAVAREIGGCDARLRAITGAPIAGFRAPGYDLSPTMLAELAARGYRYDSSIFPAPGVLDAAKLAVMAGLRRVLGPAVAARWPPSRARWWRRPRRTARRWRRRGAAARRRWSSCRSR